MCISRFWHSVDAGVSLAGSLTSCLFAFFVSPFPPRHLIVSQEFSTYLLFGHSFDDDGIRSVSLALTEKRIYPLVLRLLQLCACYKSRIYIAGDAFQLKSFLFFCLCVRFAFDVATQLIKRLPFLVSLSFLHISPSCWRKNFSINAAFRARVFFVFFVFPLPTRFCISCVCTYVCFSFENFITHIIGIVDRCHCWKFTIFELFFLLFF